MLEKLYSTETFDDYAEYNANVVNNNVQRYAALVILQNYPKNIYLHPDPVQKFNLIEKFECNNISECYILETLLTLQDSEHSY